MKSHLLLVVIFLSVCFLPAAHAEQSDFARQTAFSRTQGPAVFTIVKSGSISKFILGYGKQGTLGTQWSGITAHLKATGFLGWEPFSIERSFPLERIADGRGYLSSDLDFTSVLWYDFTGAGAPRVETMEFTFRINDRVDPQQEQSYAFRIEDILNKATSFTFESKASPAYPAVSPDVWEWVIGQLPQ